MGFRLGGLSLGLSPVTGRFGPSVRNLGEANQYFAGP